MAKNKLVFLIEDDSDIREALTQILNLEGFDVSSAENGKAALDELRRVPEAPDLILLDLVMPVMDGYKFLEEKKNVPLISNVPILILTANQSRDNNLLVEVQGFLRKPLDLEKLINTMQTMLC